MSVKLVWFGPVVLLALLGVAACSDGDSGSKSTTTSTTVSGMPIPGGGPVPMGRTFISTKVDGTPIPGGGPLTITFKDGRIGADAGCNSHGGAVTFDNNKLTVSGLSSTLMACADDRQGADGWLSGLLDAKPTWQVDGDMLTLQGNNVTVTLQDKKVAQPDKPIKGTTWIVTGLITPDAQIRSQAIDDVKPTLTIAEDGAVSGSAGCNRMIGTATGAGADLTFQIGTTKMLCGPEVMEVEQAVLKALDGKVTATVDANVLTLRNANGSGLTLRAE
ncbi:META domain-containing protein [Nocardia altamirensis]|uniref:META domain-containing protein n=1 Tax=Nocardia altamirensis TaxID=472158 RepID=UPI000840824F|nr:META domain-containing protein [Nocardia altamirensis]